MSEATSEGWDGTESEMLIRAGISYNYTIFDILSASGVDRTRPSHHLILLPAIFVSHHDHIYHLIFYSTTTPMDRTHSSSSKNSMFVQSSHILITHCCDRFERLMTIRFRDKPALHL
jgi:hypothetical protein